MVRPPHDQGGRVGKKHKPPRARRYQFSLLLQRIKKPGGWKKSCRRASSNRLIRSASALLKTADGFLDIYRSTRVCGCRSGITNSLAGEGSRLRNGITIMDNYSSTADDGTH